VRLTLSFAQRHRAVALLHAWMEAEHGRFMPWLAVFMAAGAALYFALRTEPPTWAGVPGLALGAALVARWPQAVLARAGGLCLIVAAAGFSAGALATLRAPPWAELPRHAVVVTGTVRGVDILPKGVRVTLAAPSLDGAAPLPRLLRIRLRARDPLAMPEAPLTEGDTLRVRVLLRPPAPPSYPGGRDLQRDAFFSGLAGSGFAIGPAARIAQATPAGLTRDWLALRDNVARRVLLGLPGEAGPIAATLLTGSATAIPEADRAAFRDSGLAHLLAVAGLHIGIVMGLAFGLTRFLLAAWEWAALRWPCKALAALAALAAGGFYMALTGAHLPIQRSFAMACLATAGMLTGRRAISLRGLAVAGMVLVALSPDAVLGVSFQMSFSAVLALIAGFEAARPLLTRARMAEGWRRHAGSVAALALTSLLAASASAPFGAYHFGQVQLYAVLTNLLAVPLTAFWVMPAGLAALALMPLGLEHLALVPMGWGIAGVLWIARTGAALPEAVLRVPHMPMAGLLATALGLAWLGLWRSRLRFAGVLPLCLGLASPWLAHPADILVAADDRMLAVQAGEGVFAEARSRASRFTLGDWESYWGVADATPLPAVAPGLRCAGPACRVGQGHAQALLLLGDEDAPGLSCNGVVAVVSLAWVPGICPGVPHVDRPAIRAGGAQAIWLSPAGARVLSVEATRGRRPWVLTPDTAAPAAPALPLALPDKLPDDS
jgi:competence protein ComEC